MVNSIEIHEGYRSGNRFFYFPGDGDHILHLVDTWEKADDVFIENYTRNAANNGYWLFTRTNPKEAQILVTNDTDSLTESYFDESKEIVILVHGWLGHGKNDLNRKLTKAFLEVNDVNVIVLDWSKLARRNYMTAKAGVAAVGSALGHFVNWLIEFGASYEKIHLVGFSLGAHLVGNAGRQTQSRVKRITALDPAGPLWAKDENRIVQTDAQYVEVIHTNTALYGLNKQCGDTDFYPNGGSRMPGCWLNMCSHSRSYEYMAATVIYDHLNGNECNSTKGVARGCTGDEFPMGNSDLTKQGTGIYRVDTEKHYPYNSTH
ncbi:pancreatic lipase-related protein 2-like [Epargyreus clarus]|uniref:pancreatic lipase-related protein 2-like n=1 Tax=Epargyreus clarus TaxID=520877 RepID=UPI003C2BD0B6